MAKIVIAGAADCPYFAKTELLADSLAKNLPDFNLHKIVKQPTDWEKWLSTTCTDRGWMHKRSPIVWRELVDRGGKGLLIGGANEFQEYAFGYYDLKSILKSSDMTKVSGENLKTKEEIDEEDRKFKELIKPVHICITSAASDVCYNMVEAIAKGEALGTSTDISVRFLDSADNQEAMEGLQLETIDLACPLLRNMTVTSDPAEAFSNCSLIVLLDEIEQTEDESKEDWLKRNHECFVNYAKIINDHARKDVKVIIAGRGPVNFNAYMMQQHMPDIPRQNVVAMSRMIENHAKSVLAERLNVNSASVVDVTIWGNSFDKYFLDVSKSRVHNYDGAIWGPPSFSLPVTEMVHDDKWLEGEYLEVVQKRREAVEQALAHRATASHASAVVSLVNHWWNGSPHGQMFSLGVQSEGWYGVPEGLVFSFPVAFNPAGYWTVVQDIDLSDENKDKLNDIVKDLVSENEVIYPPPYVPPPTPSPDPEPEVAAVTDDNINNSNGEQGVDDGLSLARITEDPEGEDLAASEMTRRSSQQARPDSAHSKGSQRSRPGSAQSGKGSQGRPGSGQSGKGSQGRPGSGQSGKGSQGRPGSGQSGKGSQKGSVMDNASDRGAD